MLKSGSLAIMAALAGGIVWLPAAHAGDLGDGGYGAGAYGHQQPYYSGQDDRAYANRHDDDDDDDDVRNDDDDDDDADRGTRHRDNDDDDDVIVRPRRGVYSDRGDGGGTCIPGWRVKQRLIGEGWTNFRLDHFGRGIAVVRATRQHTGHRFLLRIDRCSGQTISSVPLGRQYSMRD